MDSTLWFSADGSHLAMASFDDTDVKESSYYIYDDPHDPEFQYPKEYKVRYPKVNTTNPTAHLRVMNLADTTKWHELSAPEITVSDDHILGAVNWIGVTYQRCNVEAQVCRQMIAVNEENGWYVLYTLRCTKSGNRCFLLANVNGWQRIWELNGGDNIVYKSPEKYTVTSINGYDESKDQLYYTAVPASAPQTRHVYRNGDCLTCSLKDKFSNNAPCNYASISFSTDFSYFAATCSGPTPSYTQIYRTEGQQLIADWEINEQLRTKLATYKETQVRFLKVPVHRRFKASVRLHLPPEIDFENPDNNQATYPMIVQVYGAPNSAQVIDTFTVGFGNYLTTTKKTILCQIDGRGTANQGYDFLFSIKNRLGTVEVKDQIAVTRHLQETYSFIDRDRTGIWGWVYGGYVTSMALGKDYERVFKCGISVAPITSWMFYDSIYTERYMGLPLPEDNEGGYEISDTMWQHVARIKNHMFLLIRGNVDDKNSMVFVRALEDEDENLEQMQFPDEDDGLGGVRQHLYHKVDNFWNQCFA
ncbi:hypothetical protein RP20_CCG001851 [Aedes albopictus]|nr:hypothetical protein RP20_CCG001851 [Aedes albopictus]